MNGTEKLTFVFGSVRNIIGKGENVCYQHFILFPQWFQKGFFLQVVKALDGVGKLSKSVICYLAERKALLEKKKPVATVKVLNPLTLTRRQILDSSKL